MFRNKLLGRSLSLPLRRRLLDRPSLDTIEISDHEFIEVVRWIVAETVEDFGGGAEAGGFVLCWGMLTLVG